MRSAHRGCRRASLLSLHYSPTRAFRLACGAALAAAAGAAALGGCTRSGLDATAAAADNLSPAATAYVAIPEDGRFGTTVYAGSGEEIAMLVARALSPRLRRVELAPPGQPQPAALAEARAGGFTYLILPSVLRWEDHATAWLGGSDRARLLMKVIDIASGDVADIAVVEGRGAELPPAADVAETPAAGLEMPLRAYVDRLLPIPAAAAQK